VRATSKPIAQVAADLGINPGTLGSWVNQDKISRGEVARFSGDEWAELARLRAEMVEVRMERDEAPMCVTLSLLVRGRG
jgi:transposase-like protein